jgi:hypothetical protein
MSHVFIQFFVYKIDRSCTARQSNCTARLNQALLLLELIICIWLTFVCDKTLTLHSDISVPELHSQLLQSFGQLPPQQRKCIRYGVCDHEDQAHTFPVTASDLLYDYALWHAAFTQPVDVHDGVDEYEFRVSNMLKTLCGFAI